MNDSMSNKKSVSGAPFRVSLRTVSFLILTGAFAAFAQQNETAGAAAGKSLPAAKYPLAASMRISYQAKEKEIDDLVRQGTELETKKNEYEQAIDKYLEAKKIADELFESTSMPSFKTRSENCAVKISNAYFYWASAIYREAVRSASESDYDNAIDKCRKAIEIYPPCKVKMEKSI